MLVNLGAAAGCVDAGAPAAEWPGKAAALALLDGPALSLGMLGSPAPAVRGLRLPDGVLSAHLYERDTPPHLGLAEDTTVLDDTMDPVHGALSDDPNDALEAALDEARGLGRDPRNNGLAALTYRQLFGDGFNPGVCAPPVVETEVEHGGEDWEIELLLSRMALFVGTPEPQLSTIEDDCADAVEAAGGDLDVAEDTCGDLAIEQFFPEGSTCRACVQDNGGDVAACVEGGECPEEAPRVVEMTGESGPAYWQTAEVDMLACAPDYTTRAVLLTRIDADGGFPPAFDPVAWPTACVPTWSEALGGLDFSCFGSDSTVGQGAWGVIKAMHRRDEPSEEVHQFRSAYTPRIELDGGEQIRWGMAFSNGEGLLVMPESYPDVNGDGVVDTNDPFTWLGSPEGWGLQPYALRPDGTDPTNVDDTFARDYIAAYAIKTATTRTGILISAYDHNRCADDGWEGPFEDGSFRCVSPTAPVAGYRNDGRQTWWDFGGLQLHAVPAATLGATGLPDPSIPGNIVPLIAGTALLASAGFDGCALPTTFVPDQMAYPDHPPDWSGGALWGDTWRFGAHPELDLRFVINTNTARSWCGGEEVVR